MVSSCRQGDLALLQLLWNATLNLAKPPTTRKNHHGGLLWVGFTSVPPGACVMVFCISSFTTSRKSPMAWQGPNPDIRCFSHPASLKNTVFLWKKSILTGKNTIEININSDPTRLTAVGRLYRSMCWKAKSLALKLSAETRSSSAWFRKSALSYFLGRSQIFHMVIFCLKSDPLWLAQLDLKPIFTHLHCTYLAIRHSNFWFILCWGKFLTRLGHIFHLFFRSFCWPKNAHYGICATKKI